MIILPWDWTTSNGTATAEETQSAYDALVNHSETLDFSHKVWDDLVNKINDVNSYLFGEWDSTYLSLQDTLMGEPESTLTASRFNSARTNTKYPYWDWAYNSDSDGYIGRIDFKGVSVYGWRADKVFSSYILELVNSLNVVIGIINDTVNKQEIESTIDFELLTNAVLEYENRQTYFESVVNFILTVSSNLNSYYVVSMGDTLSIQQSINAEAEQLPYSGFSIVQAHTATINSDAVSLPSTKAHSVNDIYLDLSGLSQTNKGRLLKSNNNIHLVTDSLLLDRPFNGFSKTTEITLQTDSTMYSAKDVSPLVVTNFQGNLSSEATFVIGTPFYVQAHLYMGDSSVAELSYLISIPFNCVSESQLDFSALLQRTSRKHYFNANLTSSLNSDADLTWIQGVSLQATNNMELTSYGSMSFPWEYPVITDEDAYITQVWSTEKTGKNLFIDP